MIGSIGYFLAALVIAALISGFWVSLRPIQNRGDVNHWPAFFVSLLLVAGGPYLWVEALSRQRGAEMQDAVASVLESEKVNEGLRYFRVVSMRGDRARVVAVGLERETTGFTERPVFAITLVRGDDGWEVEDYTVVHSLSRNADGASLPPYW